MLEIKNQQAYASTRLQYTGGCPRPLRPESVSEIGAFLFLGNSPLPDSLPVVRPEGGNLVFRRQESGFILPGLLSKQHREVSHEERTVKPLVSRSTISHTINHNVSHPPYSGGFPMQDAHVIQTIKSKIHHLPHRPPFMLSRDLAELYETTVAQIAQAVRRNPDMFPPEYCFELTGEEIRSLRFAAVKSIDAKDRRMRGFPLEGANMLAFHLRTKVARKRAVMIIGAFSSLERGEIPRQAPQSYPPIVFEGLCLQVLPSPTGEPMVLTKAFERCFELGRGRVQKYLRRHDLEKPYLGWLYGPDLRAIRERAGLFRSVNVVTYVPVRRLVPLMTNLAGSNKARVLAKALGPAWQGPERRAHALA